MRRSELHRFSDELNLKRSDQIKGKKREKEREKSRDKRQMNERMQNLKYKMGRQKKGWEEGRKKERKVLKHTSIACRQEADFGKTDQPTDRHSDL